MFGRSKKNPSYLLLLLIVDNIISVTAFQLAQPSLFLHHIGKSCTALQAKKESSNASARLKRANGLSEWSKSNDVQIGGFAIDDTPGSGLGLVATQDVPSGSLVVTVPSKVALTVEFPSGGPDDSSVMELCSDKRAFRDLPWYVQFSLYLFKLDKQSPIKQQQINLQSWLDSLPRSFDTPIHWSSSDRDEYLQYQHMSESVERQITGWKKYYSSLQACTTLSNMSWEDFLWGCECARSRAFSGAYTGSAFNPTIYLFTLFLLTTYILLDLGTLEQAANGAAVVFCGTILKDFVLPKLFKTKKFVICPVIDMCNHRSLGTTADVSFEFFGDAYSLATGKNVNKGDEIFISYGNRSNDQLLQYYGFVEPDNPHDLYVMPPLREWDIEALEKACGSPFGAGRLGKLDRAGLLGSAAGTTTTTTSDDDKTGEGNANPRGGVVLTRAVGLDPAVLQALRALVASDEEWQAAGEAVGNFAEKVSSENERLARLVARTAIEMELAAKPTTLEQDKEMLKRSGTMGDTSMEEMLGLQFRIEKKKLLMETIDKLQ